MKTIKIISIVLVIIIMSGFTTYAKDNNKTAQKNDLKTILAKEVKFPTFAVEK